MVLGSTLVVAGLLCQTIALLLQSRSVSTKGTIKGLSYDWISFSALVYVTRALVACFYCFSDEIRRQNMRRTPLLPPVAVNIPIIIIDLIGIATAIRILHLLKIHQKSKISSQSFSVGLKSCLLGCYVIIPLIIVKFYIWKNTLQPVDLVDWFWLCFNVFSIVSFAPQLIMNWFHMCATAVLPLYDKWQGIGIVLIILGRLLETTKWPEIPVNWPSWPVIATSAICLVSLQLQRYTYSDGKYEILAH